MTEVPNVTLHVRDSRRLTGPSRFWNLPGAILDVGAPSPTETDHDGEDPSPLYDCPPATLVAAWRQRARFLLEAVGWGRQHLTSRIFSDGTSLVLSAPFDALYAATEINELAFTLAVRDLLRGPTPPLDPEIDRLRALIDEQSNAPLLKLAQQAAELNVLFLSDDETVSVGGGRGSQSWDVSSVEGSRSEDSNLEGRADLDIDLGSLELHDIPVAAITGTNGKSTTVRLLAAMVSHEHLQGRASVVGCTSTDWIRVGKEVIDRGDYSGPGGARRLLRDQRIDVAILETARGGLARRGLGVPRLDVGVITNISRDHLGEHGTMSLDDLLDIKWPVARVARHVVLNAEDELLRRRGLEDHPAGSGTITWFALDEDDETVRAHIRAGGRAVVHSGDEMIIWSGSHREAVAHSSDVPVTFGGAAHHNIANALAAIGAARALGVSTAAINAGLRTFGHDPEDNPGRLSRYRFFAAPRDPEESGSTPGPDSDTADATAHPSPDSALVLVDFAHNAEGVEALLSLAERLTPQRLLVVLGQAGDRDDESIESLADVTWKYQPDRILLKELAAYRRGRAAGEIPELLIARLLSLGADPQTIERTEGELESMVSALRWARPGDLLLLISHSDRELVMSRLARLVAEGWTLGSDLPEWLTDPQVD